MPGLDTLQALGLPAGIVVLWFFIYKMRKDHEKERSNWFSWIKDSQDRMINSQDRNTQVLVELKTLIKSKK